MIYEIVGWLGTIAVLLAFLLVSTKKIKPDSKGYYFLNIFGAIGIINNSLFHNAIPSVGLNIVWLLIGLYGLVKNRNT